MTLYDAIGALSGLDPARSEETRGHRAGTVVAAESSLHALFDVFDGDEAPGLTRPVRLLVAARAAHVDGAEALAEFYLEQLEEEPGSHRLPENERGALVERGADGEAGRRASREVRALLRHADLLILKPAAATADDLVSLTAAGWTTTEIVVVSQIIAFVSYQARAVHGLRVLQEAGR